MKNNRKGELNIFTGWLLGVGILVAFVLVGSAIVGTIAIIGVIIPVAAVVAIVLGVVVTLFGK
jgi:hypothetical protein